MGLYLPLSVYARSCLFLSVAVCFLHFLFVFHLLWIEHIISISPFCSSSESWSLHLQLTTYLLCTPYILFIITQEYHALLRSRAIRRLVLELALCFVLSKDEFASGPLASLSRVPTQASWRCRRKWRNGSLGFVHWASQYGYEHRRHEGEQLMNISNCTTFVFTKRSLKADLLPNGISGEPSRTDYQCSICGQGVWEWSGAGAAFPSSSSAGQLGSVIYLQSMLPSFPLSTCFRAACRFMQLKVGPSWGGSSWTSWVQHSTCTYRRCFYGIGGWYRRWTILALCPPKRGVPEAPSNQGFCETSHCRRWIKIEWWGCRRQPDSASRRRSAAAIEQGARGPRCWCSEGQVSSNSFFAPQLPVGFGRLGLFGRFRRSTMAAGSLSLPSWCRSCVEAKWHEKPGPTCRNIAGVSAFGARNAHPQTCTHATQQAGDWLQWIESCGLDWEDSRGTTGKTRDRGYLPRFQGFGPWCCWITWRNTNSGLPRSKPSARENQCGWDAAGWKWIFFLILWHWCRRWSWQHRGKHVIRCPEAGSVACGLSLTCLNCCQSQFVEDEVRVEELMPERGTILRCEVSILQGCNVSKPETTERAEPLSIVELSTAAACGRPSGSQWSGDGDVEFRAKQKSQWRASRVAVTLVAYKSIQIIAKWS